jgi:succinate-semialdehyde dehydrogenase/glutarate-semialdehyde dehydrogenase
MTPAEMIGIRDADLFRSTAYVGGQWLAADEGGTTVVSNPATGAPLGTVPAMGRLETRRAIEAAAGAFPLWAVKTAKERSVILRRWFELMMTHQDDLARI